MATIPVYSTVSAGGTLTAALWNSQIRDAGNFFLGRPHVILAQGTLQVIPTTTFTDVLWDVEVRDNDAMHSTVTNTNRATVVTAGWYRACGTAGWAGSNTNQRISRWAINGSAADGTEIALNAAIATSSAYAVTTTDMFLNAGDYVTLQIWQNTGANLNTNISTSTRSRMALLWLAS